MLHKIKLKNFNTVSMFKRLWNIDVCIIKMNGRVLKGCLKSFRISQRDKSSSDTILKMITQVESAFMDFKCLFFTYINCPFWEVVWKKNS